MKKERGLLLLILLVLIISGCNQINYSPENIPIEEDRVFEECVPKIIPGILNIKFKPGYNVESLLNANSEVEKIISDQNLEEINSIEKTFKTIKTKNYKLQKKIGLDRWVTIKLDENINLEEELQKWKLKREIEQVELVYEPCLLLTPNENPLWTWAVSWQHNNTGNSSLGGVPDADIDSVEAWDIETGNVVIGNPDTSIMWYHEDLIENIWRNLGEDFDGDGEVLQANGTETIEYTDINGELRTRTYTKYIFDPEDINGIDDDLNGYIDDFIGWDFVNGDNDPRPDNLQSLEYQWHGTQTSGIIASKGNNTKGIVGVCWDCKIIASKGVYNPYAIQYAVDNGAKVITISWMPSYSGTYKEILDYAHELGVVITTGTGNYGTTSINYLCNSENVICAAGTNNYDRWWSDTSGGSSYGAKSDVGAPANMFSTVYYNHPNAIYVYASGTSFSSPLVGGVAALILSENPTLTPDEVKSIIKSSVDRFNYTTRYLGTGRVNAYNALLLTQNSTLYGHFPISIINSNNTIRINNTLYIYGTANSENFKNYEIYYGSSFNPTSWTFLDRLTLPVSNSLIYQLDLSRIPIGDGEIKVVVNDNNGQFAFDSFPISMGPLYQPGWPQTIPSSNFVTSADLNNDKLYEIIITANQYIYVFNYDGTLVQGWPFTTGSTISSAPSFADIDKDGKLEIIASSDKIYVLNYDASNVNGWPQTNSGLYSSPVIVDINNDTFLEIIYPYSNTITIRRHNGEILPGWPYSLGSLSIYDLSVGNIDNDEDLELLFGTTSSVATLYAINPDKTNVPGFPKSFNMSIMSQPTLADLNNDGLLDIVIITSTDRKIYVLNNQGTPLPGWPRDLGTVVATNPAIADVDNDGFPEIFYGSDRLYAFNHDGTNLTGWPRTGDGQFFSPIIIDIDNDNRLEIISNTIANSLYIYNHDGTSVPGWPQISNYMRTYANVIEDIDNDGKLEIIGGPGETVIWRTEKPRTNTFDWPRYKHDYQNTGNVYFYPVCQRWERYY